VGIRRADHATPLFPQKLALTSPISGGCSTGIVRSRTKDSEFGSAGGQMEGSGNLRENTHFSTERGMRIMN
jgi:hypothetical protein